MKNYIVKDQDKSTVSKGMPHGFYESGFGEISEGEMQFLGDAVKALIKDGTISRVSHDCLAFIRENF